MTRTHRLVVVLVLNLGLVAGLVAVGVTAHSIAVLAEGGDYLLDAAGVAVALLAIWLAARPATRTRPDGYPNATTVAALINAATAPVAGTIPPSPGPITSGLVAMKRAPAVTNRMARVMRSKL